MEEEEIGVKERGDEDVENILELKLFKTYLLFFHNLRAASSFNYKMLQYITVTNSVKRKIGKDRQNTTRTREGEVLKQS